MTAPIVLVGAGRTGSTLLARLLGLHPDLAWWSGLDDRWPNRPELALLHRAWDLPRADVLANHIPKWPRPGETYGVWNELLPGFSNSAHDWGPEHVAGAAGDLVRARAARTLTYQGGKRFMTKITGFPRYELLRAALPGVSLVRSTRDPRAVVASYHRQGWWMRNRPERDAALSGFDRWDFYIERYHQFGATGEGAPADHEVVFENLVKDHQSVVLELSDALGLRVNPRFERRLRRTTVDAGAANAWRRELDADVIDYLDRCLPTD